MKLPFRLFECSLLACTILVFSCQSNHNDYAQNIIIEGTIAQIDSYGGLIASFKPLEMEAKGIDYGDLLRLYIGDNIVVDAPYVDSYNQAGNMSICICNYNKQNTDTSISLANGSFALHIGGRTGDRLAIAMKEKEGYLYEYNLLKGTYSYSREDYSSDEVFANFREVVTTGIKPGMLYRSTSPINFKSNKVRYTYADELCRKNGIKTIIDIADSDESVKEMLASKEHQGSYVNVTLTEKNIVGIGSDADFVRPEFMKGLTRALREIIVREGPFLIHCNEGKDRTGFYFLLLESLAGASLEEVKTDYMLTFENMYKQQRGTEQYELAWKKNGQCMLYYMGHPELWSKIGFVDMDQCSIQGENLFMIAQNYILLAGLSMDEIDKLKEKIFASAKTAQ